MGIDPFLFPSQNVADNNPWLGLLVVVAIGVDRLVVLESGRLNFSLGLHGPGLPLASRSLRRVPGKPKGTSHRGRRFGRRFADQERAKTKNRETSPAKTAKP